jgi:hypothetical protein
MMAIGPHEEQELTLMQEGRKPLAMFLEATPPEFKTFPEEEFDSLVAQGKLVKHVSMAVFADPSGNDRQHRRVLYALPSEEWRIPAFLFVQEIYDSLAPGWRPDLERVIGRLLGYADEDIDDFLQHLHARSRG